jgi:DNA modification methylase
LLTTQPGDLVFDPFVGSGTTLAVAQRLGRTATGCEIDPKYVLMAQQRLAQHATFNQLFEI